MAVLPLAYGLIVQGSLWYSINLLAAVALPGLTHATLADLRAFNLHALVIGTIVHGLVSVFAGLLYAVILPMLPGRHMLWGGVVAPLLWTGLVWAVIDIVNPLLGARLARQWEGGGGDRCPGRELPRTLPGTVRGLPRCRWAPRRRAPPQ